MGCHVRMIQIYPLLTGCIKEEDTANESPTAPDLHLLNVSADWKVQALALRKSTPPAVL